MESWAGPGNEAREEGRGKKRSQGEEGEGQEEVSRGGGHNGRRETSAEHKSFPCHHEFLGLFTDHATSLIMT